MALQSVKPLTKSNAISEIAFGRQAGYMSMVQIFIISNGTHTKYYSNTTRNSHIKEMGRICKAEIEENQQQL